jgi:Type IV secretion-system coupling protein DNA-binding domain/TraM recognition site of TraD and TraG
MIAWTTAALTRWTLVLAGGERHGRPSGGRSGGPDRPFTRFLWDLMLHPDKLWDHIWSTLTEWLATVAPLVIRTTIALGAISLSAVALIRLRDRRLARGGRRIRILPPPDVPTDGASVLWTALHGLIRPRWKRFLTGQPSLAWEVLADRDETQISLWIPEVVPLDLVERAVDAAWPGTSLLEAEDDLPIPRDDSLAGAQMVLARAEWFPIGDGPDGDPIRVALSAMATVPNGETTMMQMIARPASSRVAARLRGGHRRSLKGRRRSHTNGTDVIRAISHDPTAQAELRDVHEKAAAPLWECSIRLAASAPNRAAAKARAHTVAAAFAMFEGPNRFARQRLWRPRAKIRARTLGPSFVLSVGEVARLATLPTRPVIGVEAAGARILAPGRSVAADGRVLGVSNAGVSASPVAISVADARHHIHVLGQTGTGKSTLLAQLALQDAETGRAAVVIDPKGDLVEAILERLPEQAWDRTCLIDPTDPSVAVGLNVLSGPDPDLVADQIAGIFKRIYQNHWGPRSDDILRGACLTLAQIPGATLAEMPLLLTNDEWRHAIRTQLVHNPALRLFWEVYDRKLEQRRQDDIAPLMNKLRAFLLREAIRTIVGQARPREDPEALLDRGGLLLVRIPKGLLGEDTSRLLGALVIARVWQAAMRRARSPEADRSDLALYVDEMHNYLTLPRSFEDLLAEARGYGLALVLAHQHLGQLTTREMREALAANARTKVVFACSPEDARQLEDHFAPHLNAHDLSHLPAFTAACRPCVSSANATPFTFSTRHLPEGSRDRALRARIRSGKLFGVPRAQVEKEIRRRHLRPERTLLPTNGQRWTPDLFPDQPLDRFPDRSLVRSGVIGPAGGDEGGEAG